jgi:hypothetical protein
MRATVTILALALGAGTPAVSGEDGCGTFADDVIYGASTHSISLVAGDLDGDADLDLAVANRANGSVSVLLNNGDGTYAPDVLYGTGALPRCLAIGDLDGDDDLDLVTANGTSNDVSVLMNNGNGTFAPDVAYGAGVDPHGVAVGDLDGDDDLDLAVGNFGTDDVTVCWNAGDGTFRVSDTYGAGNAPWSVALGDVNSDDDLDLMVANSASDNVSVLLNNGDGTFSSAVSYYAGNGPRVMRVHDVNGDAHLDLIVPCRVSDSVAVLMNNGGGTFAPAVSYPAGDATSVEVGDVDLDGAPDLVVTAAASDDVRVFLNNGDGTFAPYVDYGAGDGPISVAIRDLDGDEDPDLAVANFWAGSVSVLMNTCPRLCDQPPENCQGLSLTNAYNSTGGTDWIVADDFTPAQDGVTSGLCWYGIYEPAAAADNFTVRYCADDNHAPGAEIATFSEASGTLTVWREDIDLTMGSAHVFRYTATHDPVELQGGTCYWLDIVNVNVEDWYWLLADEADGNARFLQDGNPPDGYGPEDLRVGGDLAFCIDLELSEPACGLHTLFDTGPERQVLFDSSGSGNFQLTYLGWSSGDLRPLADMPQRWTAQALTIPAVPGGGQWRISHIIPAGFTPDGYTNETLSFIFWSRTGLGEGSAPLDGDQVAEGSVPYPEAVDRVVGGQENALFPIASDVRLGEGDYWLTVYAGNSSPGAVPSSFAWFTDADNGINNLDGQGDPFMWRSAFFPDPGFAMYTVSDQVAQVAEGDPEDLYNAAFIIWGTPAPCPWDCGGDNDNAVGIVDFLALLGQWGQPGTCDFDGGGVGITDFLEMLGMWGACP